jgi:hypothetical protein
LGAVNSECDPAQNAKNLPSATGDLPPLQMPTRKLAARTFLQSQYLKVLAFAMNGKEALCIYEMV